MTRRIHAPNRVTQRARDATFHCVAVSSGLGMNVSMSTLAIIDFRRKAAIQTLRSLGADIRTLRRQLRDSSK